MEKSLWHDLFTTELVIWHSLRGYQSLSCQTWKWLWPLFNFDMTVIGIPLKSVKKLIQWWRDHANRTSPSKVMSDFENWLKKVLILQCKNGMLAKKLATRFPVFQSLNTKHFFFRNCIKMKESNRFQLIWASWDILSLAIK